MMLLGSVAGCASKSDPASPAIAHEAKPDYPLVANPEFANWSKFPIGTLVHRQNDIRNSLGIVSVHTELELIALSQEAATIESRTKIVRGADEDVKEPQRFSVPFQFPLFPGKTIEDFTRPSPNAERIGQELTCVGNQNFQADVYQWEGTLESGKVTMKRWQSENFPGRFIKTETDHRDQFGSKSVESVVALHIPEDIMAASESDAKGVQPALD